MVRFSSGYFRKNREINDCDVKGSVMGRRSTKEDKNIYHISREKAGFSRERASAELEFISADRLYRIENEDCTPQPEEVQRMATCYDNPSLCNYYCSHECPIGQECVPEVTLKDLSQITLEMLASLNAMDKEKNRLIEITVDGAISEDEKEDFERIQARLEQISIAADALRLWVQHAVTDGKIAK